MAINTEVSLQDVEAFWGYIHNYFEAYHGRPKGNDIYEETAILQNLTYTQTIMSGQHRFLPLVHAQVDTKQGWDTKDLPHSYIGGPLKGKDVRVVDEGGLAAPQLRSIFLSSQEQNAVQSMRRLLVLQKGQASIVDVYSAELKPGFIEDPLKHIVTREGTLPPGKTLNYRPLFALESLRIMQLAEKRSASILGCLPLPELQQKTIPVIPSLSLN